MLSQTPAIAQSTFPLPPAPPGGQASFSATVNQPISPATYVLPSAGLYTVNLTVLGPSGNPVTGPGAYGVWSAQYAGWCGTLQDEVFNNLLSSLTLYATLPANSSSPFWPGTININGSVTGYVDQAFDPTNPLYSYALSNGWGSATSKYGGAAGAYTYYNPYAWQEVNWLLNNKNYYTGTPGATAQDIQHDIWLILTGYLDPGTTLTTAGVALLQAAENPANNNFTPGPGQVMAVDLYQTGFPPFTFEGNQDLIIEAPTGAIGIDVFDDVNGNGAQDSGESGINNVTVQLCADSACATQLATTTTANDGQYEFAGLALGISYWVVVNTSQPNLSSYSISTPPATPIAGEPNTVGMSGPGGDEYDETSLSAATPVITTVDFGFVPAGSPNNCVTLTNSTGQVGVAFSSGGAAPQTGWALGAAPYSWALLNGPAGLSVNSSGVITGTPTQSGAFAVSIVDSKGDVVGSACSFLVIAPAPSLATCASITAVQGVAIAPTQLSATGGAGPTYTFTATGLTGTGLTLSSSGVLSGTPTASGTIAYYVTVKDGKGNAGSPQQCSITVAPAPSANCVAITATKGAAIAPVALTGTGGAGGPYTFTATGLPTGLSISSGGTISGTPTVGGTFSYTVTITDKAGNKGTLNCSVTVTTPTPPTPPPLTVTCPGANTASVGSGYSSSVTASGGAPPYTYSVGSGALPPGLTLNSSAGTITGTPTSAGTYGFTIEVTDSTKTVAYSACSGSCANGVTNSWNFATQTGQLGNVQGYSVGGIGINAYGFDTWGNPHSLYSQIQSGNEWGLGVWGASNNEVDSGHFIQLDLNNAINAHVGNAQLFVGSQNCAGTYQIYGSNTLGQQGTLIGDNVPANNKGFTIPNFGKYRYLCVVAKSGCCVTLATFCCNAGCCQIVVTAAIELQCGSCGGGNATVGQAYSSTLSVTGGTGPYAFSIVSGSSLPPGLTLNSSTGVISGTPSSSITQTTTYTFTSKVVDAKGNSDTQTCSIKVLVPAIDLDCGACSSSAKATVGQAYAESLTVSNGTPPYTFSITSGSLPPGLTLNTSTGAISGTPTTAGTYTFSSKVVDKNGSTDATSCSITVTAAPAKTQTINLECGACGSNDNATVGQAYSESLTVNGGTPSYTFSITSGSLPPGLTLKTSTGVISGSPSTAGTYTFTTKVVDSKGNTDTASCTIKVCQPPLELQSGNCGQYGQTGQSYSGTWQTSGGQGPYNYSIDSGSLPPGLTLNSKTGNISGAPTTPGFYVFTGKVTDSQGNSDDINCLVVVTGGWGW